MNAFYIFVFHQFLFEGFGSQMTSCVKELRVLETLSEKERALALLKEIAVWVEPVMKKRNWCVPLVAECNFRNPGILGMNHNGEKNGRKENFWF